MAPPCAKCTIYNPDNEAFRRYYQRGSGAPAIFRGTPYQEGYGNFGSQDGAGIGDFFGSMFRGVAPVLSNIIPVIKSAGRSLLSPAQAAAADLLTGKSTPLEAVKEHGIQALKNVGETVAKGLVSSLSGERKRSPSPPPLSPPSPPPVKRARITARASRKPTSRYRKSRTRQRGGSGGFFDL